MALRDTLAPIIRLICLICYAAYTFLGLILFIVGLYYNFAVEGSNAFVTLTACFGGFFMLLVGALGIFASWKEKALFMGICLLVDTLLFIFLLAACITGMFIAFNIQDPVAEGVQLAYCDEPAKTTHIFCNEKISSHTDADKQRGKNVRALAWGGVKELFGNGAPGSCEDFNNAVLGGMVETAREAAECGFVDCTDTNSECVGTAGLTAADCACLEPIPQIDSSDAQEESCEPRSNATDTVCTLTAASPAGCGIPAREADGPVPGDADYYSAQVEGGVRSDECETAGHCSDPYNCIYTPKQDEFERVYAQPARTQACPSGCNETVEVLPEPAVVEACIVIGTDQMSQPAYCRNCDAIDSQEDYPDCYSGDDLITNADCSAAGGDGSGDGVTSCSGACVLADAFDCHVVFQEEGGTTTYLTEDNTQGGTQVVSSTDTTGFTGAMPTAPSTETHHCKRVSTDAEGARTIESVSLYCAYTPPDPGVVAVPADCAPANVAVGSRLYPDAEPAVLGCADLASCTAEETACTDDCPSGTCTDDCEAKPDFMGDCSAVADVLGGETSVAYRHCNTCWDHWQYYKIDQVKGNLWPATIAIFALFLFIVILTGINLYLVDNSEDEEEGGWKPDGIMKILSLVFNGIVLLFGLIVIIAGAYMYSTLSSGECPEGADCTNWSIVSIIIVGVAVFGTTVVSIVAVAVLGGTIGLMMLRVANLVFMLTALLTLICGIAIAIIAGALDESNKQFEENFDTVRAQYEQKDPNVCKVGGRPLEDAECKKVIRQLVSEANTGVIILLTIICFSFLGVAFFTLEAFYIFSASGDDDDDDDDDDDA